MAGIFGLAYSELPFIVVGKIWDAFMGKFGEYIIEKFGEYIIDPIRQQFIYMCCFVGNFGELETLLEELQTTIQGVQMWVEDEHTKLNVIGQNIEAWLKNANEVTSEVGRIIQEKPKVKEGCLNGWCPNLKLHYSLSRKAVKKTKVIVDLQAAGVPYTKLSFLLRPTSSKTIPNKDFMVFNSRRIIMEDIISALTDDDDTTLIGICGLAGVGKTKIVQEVRKRAKEENLFDEVAFVAVGQYPDLTKFQNSIADIFGLEDLKKLDDATTRASLLRQRLSQDNKRILLILDDIWAEIDLEDQGIPLGGSHESLKILYTSRSQGVWHDIPTKKEIALKLLSKEEAWQLFREKAGDLADTPNLRPIAKQIVNKCGRLPLALIIIGRALSRKSRDQCFIKAIWKDTCHRLICPSSIPADKGLSSSLKLSYNFVEDEEAKRLFLLCCLCLEDQSIWIEDLARFAYGLSLFHGVNEMREVRHRVFSLIDDLKSRYLLLDGEDIHYESVKVHDIVRDMGISIASKDKRALVSHDGDWPKKDTYNHYTSISVVLRTIAELPQGLTCKNLKFLMIYYGTIEKLPNNLFEGMRKLEVLYLCYLNGIPTLRSLRNLRQLTLYCCDMLPSASDFRYLLKLEILSFNATSIKELPEEIGELVNLRLLDLRYTDSLDRIPPGVILRLVCLEELHLIGSKFTGWEGEGEEEGRNANLREFECLPNLSTLQIVIRNDVVIPKVPIFSKLEIFTVVIVDSDDHRYASLKDYEKQLSVISPNLIPLDGGGIDSLLKSADYLFLGREGCNDLVRELVRWGAVDGLQQLKNLEIVNCDTPECLANTMNLVQQRNPNAAALFPILEKTSLYGLHNLREICRGPVPACSFGKLTQIAIKNCGKLKNLFQLPIVGCLTQLKHLTIEACAVMEEVIQKEQREDFATIRIEFPKLEYLTLAKLPSLKGFCRGIDQIDFPQLKYMYLRHLGPFKCLFHNNSDPSSNLEQNNGVDFLSLFPQKVSLPNLEVLDIAKLENLERLGHCPVSIGSLSKLKEFSVQDCGKLLCVFESHLLPILQDLEKLIVKCCNLLEVVFELEGVDSNEPNPEILSPLKFFELHCLPKLNYISKRDPMGFKYIQTLDIIECDSLRCVFSPTMTKIIPHLCKLKIWSCEELSRIVGEENGLGESTMDEVQFPQLETVELRSLPNLVSFFPNMNTTTLEKSTDHYHYPLQSEPLFNEKVAIPNLKYLELIRLENVSDLWCSELLSSSFFKLKKLEVRYCARLRNMFHPSMARGLVDLQELLIEDCSTLEAVVGKEEDVVGGQGRKIDKTLFPLLGKLKLGSLSNLKRFCNSTHPLELPKLSQMDILFCPSMDAFSSEPICAPNLTLTSISWNGDLNNAVQLLQKNGDDPMVISKENPRTLNNVTDKTTPCQLVEIVDPTELQPVAMPDSTNRAHKVAQLLYTNSGDGVLAVRCNGILRPWKWDWSEHNRTAKAIGEEAIARIVPHQWQPSSGLVMTNDLTGVNLEKAVPCIALSKNDSYIISACGGKFSIFNIYTFKVMGYFLPPPPASTFLAFHPQYNNIIAIGMEDSTILIHNIWENEVKSKLEGHQKCITGLAFSTNLNILVSSAADAQLCIWSIDKWEKLNSVPIQLPAGKARNGDTRVQFHSDQIRLLVSHETQLAIYDASKMDRIGQWVPQDVLPAPISFAAYSCNSQIVYTSFCDGNIGVFDADSLTLRCRIAPSAYLSPTLLNGSQVVYPSVIAAHPKKPRQLAIGLTEGSVIDIECPTIRGVNGMLNDRTASSSNTSSYTPDQGQASSSRFLLFLNQKKGRLNEED